MHKEASDRSRMKILGIIAEYNPFHKGHKYQIEKARQISGADYVVAVISGNYVQRGAPAIFDKSIRTKMALLCKADAVFEIPCFFSASSAPDFADFGVSLLEILGADYISFGAEDNDINLLTALAKKLNEGITEADIKEGMGLGLNYAKARHSSLLNAFKSSGYDIKKVESIISSPNNILAIEYLKNIISKNFKMEPVIIERSGSGYHEREMDNKGFSSATAIRKEIWGNGGDNSGLVGVPTEIHDCYKVLKPVFEDDFLFAAQRSILEKLYKDEDLSKYCDITAELANTIKKNIYEPDKKSFSDFILGLKSKNYTYTRISRGIFHILLNHLKSELEEFKSDKDMNSYIRLLGFRKSSSQLLGEIKKRSKLPVISKVSNAKDLLGEKSLKLFENNIYSDFLYNSIYFEKYGERLINPYRRSVVTV